MTNDIELHTKVAAGILDYLESERTLDDVFRILGISHGALCRITESTEDQIPFPVQPTGMHIATSSVHGNGVFAAKRLEKGELIAPARINGKRTPAGCHCNHGANPNAEMVMRENGDIDLVAFKDIEPGTEVLSDYFFNFINMQPWRPIVKNYENRG